jgi:hypothetical protein
VISEHFLKIINNKFHDLNMTDYGAMHLFYYTQFRSHVDVDLGTSHKHEGMKVKFVSCNFFFNQILVRFESTSVFTKKRKLCSLCYDLANNTSSHFLSIDMVQTYDHTYVPFHQIFVQKKIINPAHLLLQVTVCIILYSLSLNFCLMYNFLVF